jgi:3-oxoacyl-[acyl-carrier protein] reductase
MTQAQPHGPGPGRLVGRVAVVTGGASGLGAATAVRLAAEGAAVALLDLTREAGEDVVTTIEQAGGVAHAYACDVSDRARVDTVRDDVLERFGQVDVLVNNAGILRDNPLVDLSDEDWSAVLSVNLSSMFYTCRAFAPTMIERAYGKIVNLSSRSALGNANQANYSAAKAGVQGFTATLAIELGPHNINVNAVAPGCFATGMTADYAERNGVSGPDHWVAVAARTPLRRVGQPAELASAVAFLASDDASYVSGHTLYVNGGALLLGG